MQFPEPPRRPPPQSVVPMINVVFLLLIFFLMTARIAPQPPFPVAPPEAADGTAPPEAPLTLYLSAGGRTGFGDVSGPAALDALTAARVEICRRRNCAVAPVSLVLRADAGLPAADLAALLPRLAAAGFGRIALVTAAP